MTTLAKKGNRKITQTNYSPLFGYKSLVNLLKNKGMDVYRDGKSRNTNSYYIEACNDDETITFEIRLSDHTKMQETKPESTVEVWTGIKWEFWNGQSYESMQADIISSEGFQKAKEAINSL